MLEFVGKYFLLGDVHSIIDYIVFCCFFCANICLSLIPTLILKTKVMKIISFIFLITLYLFFIWLMVGDSTTWSIAISTYLTKPL